MTQDAANDHPAIGQRLDAPRRSLHRDARRAWITVRGRFPDLVILPHEQQGIIVRHRRCAGSYHVFWNRHLYEHFSRRCID